MSQGYIQHVRRSKQHRCSPPGWWRRLTEDVGYGTIWECDCGRRYIWAYENYAAGPEWSLV
jgi:hypothetical protein